MTPIELYQEQWSLASKIERKEFDIFLLFRQFLIVSSKLRLGHTIHAFLN